MDDNGLQCIWEISNFHPNILDLAIKNTQDLKTLNILLDAKLKFFDGSSSDNKISIDISHIYKGTSINSDLLKETLSKALIVSNDPTALLLELLSYIQHNDNTDCKINVAYILDVVIRYCYTQSSIEFLFEHLKYEYIITFLLGVTECKSVRKQIYETITFFYSILPVNAKVNSLNVVFHFCQTKGNLDTLCALLYKVDVDVIKESVCCFNTDDFWHFLGNCLMQSSPALNKQGIYIMKYYINNFYNSVHNTYISVPELSENSWDTFFLLIDIGKEKQLHLVEPALELLKDIEIYHFIWQKCIYEIYLNHCQPSIVYNVLMHVLQQNYEDENLKSVLKLILPAINVNDYNEETCKVYLSFQTFSSKKCKKDFDIILNEILLIPWNSMSLWKVIQNIFVTENKKCINIDYFKDILSCIVKLSHTYVKTECIKYVINYFWDGRSFYKMYKIAKSLKNYNINYHSYFQSHEISEEIVDFIINELLILSGNDGSVDKIEICIMLLQRLNFDIISTTIMKHLHKLNPHIKLFVWNMYLKSPTYSESGDLILQTEEFLIEYFLEHLSSNTTSYFLTLLITVTEKTENFHMKIVNLLIQSSLKPNIFKKEQIFVSLAFLNKFPILLREHDNSINNEQQTIGEQIFEIWSRKIFTERDTYICKEYIHILFKLYNNKLNLRNTTEITELFKSMFDCHNNELLVFLYEKILTIIQLTEVPDVLFDFLKFCYSKLKTLKKDVYFKKILIHYINAAYCDNLVSNVGGIFLTNNKLLEFSATYPVIKFHLISSIRKLLHEKNCSNFVYLMPTILEIYLQGIITTKDERTEYFICQEFLEETDYSKVVDTYENSNPNVLNISSRIIALEAILEIAKYDVSTVIDSLRGEYLKFFKKRYFPNSEIHIRKLRITQALLTITPFVKSYSKEAIQIGVFLLDCFIEESNQICVKQLFNWILIVLLQGAAYAGIEYIKRVMTISPNVSPSVLIGLAPTFYHLALSDTEDFIRSFTAVLSLALPWSMGAQFKLRLYGQDILRRLIDEAKENNYTEFLEKYDYLEKSINTCIEATGQSYENTMKTDLVFLNHCNPMSDNSFKSILYDIPRLNSVNSPEWENTYPCILGLSLSGCLKTLCEKTPLASKDQAFSDAIDNYVKKQPKTEISSKEETVQNVNIQKKITPWKDTSEENDESGVNSNFILIASLIEKPQNLGGLSRTCEAFGVRNLVFHDAKVVENKEFQSLSMSSEGWVRVTEVKIKDLRDGILSYQKDGYCVIGAEQTTRSVKLNEFQFPEKTILILGNEKTGIPANLIPLLDVCLEIPQMGQTRSLNVHVAGATIIWEYVKQHTLQKMEISE